MDRKDKCNINGTFAERTFALDALENLTPPWFLEKVEREDDMGKHQDFLILNRKLPGGFFESVDVKGLKAQDHMGALLEIRAVQHPKKVSREGWMFGKATYIVFYHKQQWIIIRRTTLINIMTKFLAENSKGFDVSFANGALGEFFHRRFHSKHPKDRDCTTKEDSDLITLVPWELIIEQAFAIIPASITDSDFIK
jgi:hypothetical protein